MPDERQDSIRQGIHALPESPAGQAAAEKRREQAREAPPIGAGVGGSSDADRPADEARRDAARQDLQAGADADTLYDDIPEDRVGG